MHKQPYTHQFKLLKKQKIIFKIFFWLVVSLLLNLSDSQVLHQLPPTTRFFNINTARSVLVQQNCSFSCEKENKGPMRN